MEIDPSAVKEAVDLPPIGDLVVRGTEPPDHQLLVVTWNRTARRSRPEAGAGIGVVVLLALASCAPGPNTQHAVANGAGHIAGFWLGLWHGIIAPITFLISLFSSHVNVYEIHNNGNWYNFGQGGPEVGRRGGTDGGIT